MVADKAEKAFERPSQYVWQNLDNVKLIPTETPQGLTRRWQSYSKFYTTRIFLQIIGFQKMEGGCTEVHFFPMVLIVWWKHSVIST